jgi:WD40 repeat protein
MPFNIQSNPFNDAAHSEQIIRAWRIEPDKAPVLIGDLLVPTYLDNNLFNLNQNLTWNGNDAGPALLFEFEGYNIGRWELNKSLPSLDEQRQVVKTNAGQISPPASAWPYFQLTGQVLGKASSDRTGIWNWLPDHKHQIYCSNSNCYIQELLAPGTQYKAEQAQGIRFEPPPLGIGSKELTGNGISLSVSPDGRMTALALPSGLVSLYDAATGKLFNSFTAHQGAISGLSFSPDGHYLVTSGADRTVKVWDTANWRPQAVLRLVTTISNFSSVQWLPDNKTLGVSADYRGSLLFWRALS